MSSKIHIDGIPEYGAKSRVETQIKLCLSLVNHAGCHIPHWPYIRIPTYLLARTNRRNQHNESSDGSTTAMVSDESKVLNLEARVICASDETKDIKTCPGCAKREVGRTIATGETPIILITDDHKAIKESMAQRNKVAEHYLTPLPTPKQEQDDIWCSITPFHLPNDTCPTNNEIRSHALSWPIRMACLDSTEPLQVQDGRTLCMPTLISVVPDKGPLMGGLEITLFGHDFSPDLILMFGHCPAVMLQCHATHLVCVLPPADRAGRCLISFQDTPLIRACPTFDYHDTSCHDISHLTYRMLSSPFLYSPLAESDIIYLLSQHGGIPLTETTSSGQTLLHLACHLGYLELALYLIHRAPMLVDYFDRNGLSALYFVSNSSDSLHTILLESQWVNQSGI
ncbi:hypothetical protein A0J61_01965 [Choanephora cucurbitarum]|uniref:Uncharacterized protein n=1 Tax=Choanephora cucurbitarum TaxID=101091 RepID=A0A1C7NLR9_9FUNG|nr:hypothetical protein A0J61_01965 [Choanephora cucurbitarum]